jgi:signal transduction histidine kinase
MSKIVSFFYKNFIEPRSKDEDLKGRELIINILLVSIASLFAVGMIVTLYQHVLLGKNSAFAPEFFLIIFLIFFAFNLVSRAGHFIFSAYAFLVLLFILTVYVSYSWGVEVPSVPLFLAMIIVMSGVLISNRFLFIMTIVSSLFVAIFTHLQLNSITHPDLYWKIVPFKYTDVVGFVTVFLVIAIVSWLFNREIEKSLARARKSEAALKKERDSLEIKVEERTKDLKDAQIEKLAQISRFAEFGRLSSGLFHDLINPLTAVSLNIEKIKDERGDSVGVVNAESHLEKAMQATKKMEEFILAVRKQISNEENNTCFSLEDEIRQIIGILSHKALKAKVEISLSVSSNIRSYGDVVKFNQIMANLASNAIDACDNIDGSPENKDIKMVMIDVAEKDHMIYLVVKDNGRGIPSEHMNKIFDPFFTTKGFYKGIGIGLSLTKNIVEKYFSGTIDVESIEGEGAKFIIKFPKKAALENSNGVK